MKKMNLAKLSEEQMQYLYGGEEPCCSCRCGCSCPSGGQVTNGDNSFETASDSNYSDPNYNKG